MPDKSTSDVIQHLATRCASTANDPVLAAASRGLIADIALVCNGFGTMQTLGLRFDGASLSVTDAPAKPDVTVTASAENWAQVFLPVPPRGAHSFAALQLANKAFTVTGDGLVLAQARASFERLLELLREPAPIAAAPAVQRDVGQIRGSYKTITANGTKADIYIEEAGSGLPILFLHTAGADFRQYRDLLADIELAKNWRLITFDMPHHGRSFPPTGWDCGNYRLDTATYTGWVRAVIEQYIGEPVILAGCSMGAALTLVMAADHSDLLRGAIAIEPPLRSRGRRNPYLQHACVAAGLHNAAYVYGLLSPTSPPEYRRKAAWIYSQGAPGVYTGDLIFYSDEFDGEIVASRIDATKLPVHLLSGLYDFSATIEDGQKLSDFIPGSVFRQMPALGHFPMTEHPDLFRIYLAEALADIRARTREKV